MDLVANTPLIRENLVVLAWKYVLTVFGVLHASSKMLASCDPVREQKKMS